MIRTATQRKILAWYDREGWSHQQRVDLCRRTCGVPWPQTDAQGQQVLRALKAARPMTGKKQQALAALYRDLGWTQKQQTGFNRRTCGAPQPTTEREANQVYHGLEEILKRLVRPHYMAFTRLVHTLLALRPELTPWERDTFLPNVTAKLGTPAKVSPKMIKKVREIAHKHDIPCGFPSLRELADAHFTHTRAAAAAPKHRTTPQ